MSEATPTVPESGTTPAAPVATPSVIPETVTLTKEEHDQLARDAARAASNQRKADLFDRQNGKGGSRFGSSTVVTPPTEEERAAAGAAEDQKASRGLTKLALDPAFREVLDADPTLRNLLAENPLAILPILAPDALDADDAVSLVRDALTARKKPAVVTPPAITPKPETKVPPVGAVDTPTAPDVNAVEAARKIPNTEQAIASMIGLKVRK